jgi:hypothetical protein
MLRLIAAWQSLSPVGRLHALTARNTSCAYGILMEMMYAFTEYWPMLGRSQSLQWLHRLCVGSATAKPCQNKQRIPDCDTCATCSYLTSICRERLDLEVGALYLFDLSKFINAFKINVVPNIRRILGRTTCANSCLAIHFVHFE